MGNVLSNIFNYAVTHRQVQNNPSLLQRREDRQNYKNWWDRSLNGLIVKVYGLLKQTNFTTKQFVDLMINECRFADLTKVSIFTGLPKQNDYEYHSAIRSFAYELSPSSKQWWFKGGKKFHTQNDITDNNLWKGIRLINKDLAIKNTEEHWLSQRGPGTGKNWIIVNMSNQEWNEEIYGKFPNNDELNAAANRVKGFQGLN
jgi:hypothetical protein